MFLQHVKMSINSKLAPKVEKNVFPAAEYFIKISNNHEFIENAYMSRKIW